MLEPMLRRSARLICCLALVGVTLALGSARTDQSASAAPLSFGLQSHELATTSTRVASRRLEIAEALATLREGRPTLHVSVLSPRLDLSRIDTAARPRSAPGAAQFVSAAAASAPPAGYWGGTYYSSDGQAVTVYVSSYYAPDEGVGPALADFFARGLVHGQELAQLQAVVVQPPPLLSQQCGSPYALACYRPDWQTIFIPGSWSPDIPIWSVIAHEYGHHIANHQLNPPWLAIAWGTKRWASYANVCGRASDGSAFPGDEGSNYRLNPGEAFAETYRILNEQAWGQGPFWFDVVDQSFMPDQAAIDAVGAE